MICMLLGSLTVTLAKDFDLGVYRAISATFTRLQRLRVFREFTSNFQYQSPAQVCNALQLRYLQFLELRDIARGVRPLSTNFISGS